MTVLAVDPGCDVSAWVLYDGLSVRRHGIEPNARLLARLQDSVETYMADALVIEEIASYGMPVGREVFQTVRWAAKIEQAALENGWAEASVQYLPRRDVKLHLCQSARAKDSNVRQAVVDRFGGEKAAKGTKAAPGPCHGLTKDCWQALALAVTWWDQHHGAAALRVG